MEKRRSPRRSLSAVIFSVSTSKSKGSLSPWMPPDPPLPYISLGTAADGLENNRLHKIVFIDGLFSPPGTILRYEGDLKYPVFCNQ